MRKRNLHTHIHAHTKKRTHTHKYIQAHTHSPPLTHTQTPQNTNIRRTHNNTHKHTQKHIQIHTHLHTHFTHIHTHTHTHTHTSLSWVAEGMGWQQLVGAQRIWSSFAKEPYKRDLYFAKETYILQKRPIFRCVDPYMCIYIQFNICVYSARDLNI